MSVSAPTAGPTASGATGARGGQLWRPMPPSGRRPGRTIPAVRTRAESDLWPFVFVAAHAPLALALRFLGLPALAHPLGVTLLALYWASRRRVDRAIYAAAYIAASDVLWRMTASSPTWEYSKYALVLVLGFLVLQARTRLPTRWPAAVYFLLLIPSCVLTVQGLGVGEEAFETLSFNLSGPLALSVSVLVLSRYAYGAHLRVDRVALAILAPACGVATLAAYSTVTAESIYFYARDSNFVTSGGFGPNQVSAVLGLGAFMAFVLGAQARTQRARWLYLAISLGLLGQAVLTFSRGGVLNALVAICAYSVHFLHQPRARVTLLALLAIFALVGLQLVTPALDQYTGGALSERYSDLDTSGRSRIMESEVELWQESPVLGVGAGMSKYERSTYMFDPVAAHTEYTRLLAEHGLFGMLALLVLSGLVFQLYRQAPHPLARAWIAGVVIWSLAEMGHAAMRISIISLLFGLAAVAWSRPPRPR